MKKSPETKVLVLTQHDNKEYVLSAIKAGAAGVSIGRNVFQNREPALMTKALVEIVHNGTTPARALSILGGKSERVLART